MTDIVLFENGPHRVGGRAARREIIDHIAAQMAYQKGRTWSRMTDARREQMRAQVRSCLRALCFAPSWMSDAESYIAVDASMSLDDGADATTVANHAMAYISEVLK